MKKGKWFLIAGIAIGAGAAVAGAVYAVHRAMNKMHFFDLDVEADDEFMESIIPQPKPKTSQK